MNIAQVYSLADAGDTPVRPYSCKETLDAMVDFAETIGEPEHTRLFAIGGDHSIAYGNIRATWERRGSRTGGLALIHFDAHLDTADVIWGEQWTHGSPFRRAIEDGLIDPKRMLSIGIRGPLNTSDDLEYAKSHGVQIVTAGDVMRGDGRQTIARFLKALGDDEAYLTFDIDCVDPAFAPGTGTPCSGGFSSSDVLSLLRMCAGKNIVGADLVEVLPDRDPSQVTALLASHVMFEIIAAAAVRERG